MANLRNGVIQEMYYDDSTGSCVRKGVRGEFIQKTGETSKNIMFMTRDELMKHLRRHN